MKPNGDLLVKFASNFKERACIPEVKKSDRRNAKQKMRNLSNASRLKTNITLGKEDSFILQREKGQSSDSLLKNLIKNSKSSKSKFQKHFKYLIELLWNNETDSYLKQKRNDYVIKMNKKVSHSNVFMRMRLDSMRKNLIKKMITKIFHN